MRLSKKRCDFCDLEALPVLYDSKAHVSPCIPIFASVFSLPLSSDVYQYFDFVTTLSPLSVTMLQITRSPYRPADNRPKAGHARIELLQQMFEFPLVRDVKGSCAGHILVQSTSCQNLELLKQS